MSSPRYQSPPTNLPFVALALAHLSHADGDALPQTKPPSASSSSTLPPPPPPSSSAADESASPSSSSASMVSSCDTLASALINHCKNIQAPIINSSTININSVTAHLQSCLLNFAHVIRPILLDVVARAVSLSTSSASISQDVATTEGMMILFGNLLPNYPQLTPLSLEYFTKSRSSPFNGALSTCLTDESSKFRAQIIISSVQTFFKHYASHSDASLQQVFDMWSYGVVFDLCSHDDVFIRSHTARIVSILLQLNVSDMDKLATRLNAKLVDNRNNDYVPPTSSSSSSPQYHSPESLHPSLTDLSSNNLVLRKRNTDTAVVTPSSSPSSSPSPPSSNNIPPPQPTDKTSYDVLVPTETTTKNLTSLSLSLLGKNAPVLISGPQGSGKSSLIRYIANQNGNSDMLELHLDDQMDSKTLIGSFVCTDIPGEFTWQPGALTQAVRKGQWVLIEDIDRAPFEILCALLPLMESRTLPVSSRGGADGGELAHPAFRLFGTSTMTIFPGADAKRMRAQRSSNSPLLDSTWKHVYVTSLAHYELLNISTTMFPSVPVSVLEKCLSIYRALDGEGDTTRDACDKTGTVGNADEDRDDSDSEMQVDSSSSSSSSSPTLRAEVLNLSRKASVRDFFKLSRRISNVIEFEPDTTFVTESQRLLCASEAFDVFAAASPDEAIRKEFAATILAPAFKLTTDSVLSKFKSEPKCASAPEYFQCGRIQITKVQNPNTPALMQASSGFVETAYSMRLMETIASSINQNEPTLLCGETGCGKTTIVQRLAACCGRELIVQNLSLQTDSADLLGGYRPLEIKHLARPMYVEFLNLFVAFFSKKQNEAFLTFVATALQKQQFKKLSQCFIRAAKMGLTKLANELSKKSGSKKKSAGGVSTSAAMLQWEKFAASAEKFERQRIASESGLAFTFTEGILVKAIKEGSWVLLDEINLASSETLQRLFGLLDGAHGTVTITERGDVDAVVRHPDFRLFAAMNPATDSGKKDLPSSMRARFSEVYVGELTDAAELRMVSSKYLSPQIAFSSSSNSSADNSESPIYSSIDVYLTCRKLAESVLADGGGLRPRYTLRTLCRGLAASVTLMTKNKLSLQRALLEGFQLAFECQLDIESQELLRSTLHKALGKGLTQKDLDFPPQKPNVSGNAEFTLIKPFWLECGPLPIVDWAQKNVATGISKFVLTNSAKKYLRCLTRCIAAGPWPLLIEGPTSAGKTTMVEYLAARTGHRCVRINNHEHTDVQEYTGCYVANSSGSLVFREGILVEALRNGYWIILDELNLAPSEVLEALNRLLDDNRELFVPETQETIKPHPSFRLFATQNPAGAYGGRKPLSRAFRNRFVEIHMGDIPNDEMVTILELRCGCAPTHAKLLVQILNLLQQRRSKSGVFQGKNGLITPRDLLRWAERKASSKHELAFEGYCLLAERLRDDEEKQIVKKVIEQVIGVKLDTDAVYYSEKSESRMQLKAIYENESALKTAGLSVKEIAPTSSLLRLLQLVGRCISQKEPVLLVGDTGCGKTTVCQLYSLLFDRHLHVVNCHANTETSDLLGGLRPLRGREGKAMDLVESVKELVQLGSIFLNSKCDIVVPEFLAVFTKSEDVDDSEVEMKDVAVALSYADMESLSIKFARSFFEFIEAKLAPSEIEEAPDPKTEVAANKRKRIPSHPAEEDEVKEGMSTVEIAAPDADPEPDFDYSSADIEGIRNLIKIIETKYQRANAMFEWLDGPLVTAMRHGDLILLDEMSLAEDAVLERLNSVLEPARLLVLAERGGSAEEEGIDEIHGAEDFRIFATMNPGGDFGKRELSPALRSRFTEIWVPAINKRVDFELVLNLVLGQQNNLGYSLLTLCSPMLDYVEWFNSNVCGKKDSAFVDFTLSLRDVLGWAHFISTCCIKSASTGIGDMWQSFLHGAALMHLDGLGLGTGLNLEDAKDARAQSHIFLKTQIPAEYLSFASQGFDDASTASSNVYSIDKEYISNASRFGVLPFTISTGPIPLPEKLNFSMTAPTTGMNLRRVVRAMQLSKPVLLEGSPGVGKTSLIQALAAASGHKLVRINLSEQTDIGDLMGSDLPIPAADGVEGEEKEGSGANFSWCDGVFLRALKNGDWVLLDELNLASQSVLEGLNSCLDHRAQVFIPELGQTFDCPPSFRVFAAQNPLAQGGGRKGLPKSFLNRFTKVFVEALTSRDLCNIVFNKFSTIRREVVENMVKFNEQVQDDIVENRVYGQLGFPWEFNLRDVFRWCELVVNEREEENVGKFVDAIYLQRMRTVRDRALLQQAFEKVFQSKLIVNRFPAFNLTGDLIQIGGVTLNRAKGESVDLSTAINVNVTADLPRMLRRPLETVARCVKLNWPCLLIGPTASGKSTLIRALSKVSNIVLEEAAMTPATDVTELLGCFEQCDSNDAIGDLWSLLLLLFREVCFENVGSEKNKSFKTKAVCDLWWALKKRRALCGEGGLQLSADSTSLSFITQLLKSFGSMCSNVVAVEKARALLRSVQQLNKNQQKKSHFQWVDGVLVRAMEHGHWLHLQNVNFCPSSVLDRLNPLMEVGGELLLTECGVVEGSGVRVVKPHKNFRLFLSMNADTGGEVSRAMRNRCIELCLVSETSTADLVDFLKNQGIDRPAIASQMLAMHSAEIILADKMGESPPTIKSLSEWTKLYVDLTQRGWKTDQAMKLSFCHVYAAVNKVGLGYSFDFDSDEIGTVIMIETVSLENDWLQDTTRARCISDGRLINFLSAMSGKIKSIEGPTSIPLGLQLYVSGQGQGQAQVESDNFYTDRSSKLWLTKDVEVEHLIYAAAANFVRNSFFNEFDERRNFFVDSVGIQCTDFMFDALNKSALWASYRSLVESKFGDHSEDISPLDGRDNWQLLQNKISQPDAAFSVLSKLHCCVSDRLEAMYAEYKAYHSIRSVAARSLIVENMSPIQVSMAIYVGLVDRSSVTSTVILALYPFFNSVDTVLKEWECNSNEAVSVAAEAFYTARDKLWGQLNSKELKVMESFDIAGDAKFLVEWRWFMKSFKVFKMSLNDVTANVKSLAIIIDRIYGAMFDSNSSGGMSLLYDDRLWKMGGHPLAPTSADQFDARKLLRACGEKLSFITEDRAGFVSVSGGDASMQYDLEQMIANCEPTLFPGDDIRKEVLMALCTIQWATTDELRASDGSKQSNVNALDSDFDLITIGQATVGRLSEMERKFQINIDSATMDVKIQTVENQIDVQSMLDRLAKEADEAGYASGEAFIETLLTKFGKVQAAQIADHWSVSEESCLIGDFCRISTAHARNQNDGSFSVSLIALLPRLKKFIDASLAHSNRSINTLRPYQTLLWALEKVRDDSNGADIIIRRLLRSILPVMICGNHRDMWCNSFNYLDIVSPTLAAPSFWQKQSGGFEDTGVSDSISNSIRSAGSTRLSQDVRSVAVARLMGTWGDQMRGLKGTVTRFTLENANAKLLQSKDLLLFLSSLKLRNLDSAFDSVQKCCFINILTAYRSEFETSGDDVDGLISSLIDSAYGLVFAVSAESHEQLLLSCKNERFVALATAVLAPLSFLLSNSIQPLTYEARSAMIWVYLGLAQLHLYSPSSPLDPGAKPAAKVAQREIEIRSLSTKLTVSRWENQISTGEDKPQPRFEGALITAQLASKKRDKDLKKVIERPKDAQPFVSLFREIHRFASSVASVDNVRSLANALMNDISDSDSDGAAILAKEINWQSSASTFANQLESSYAAYEDVVGCCVLGVRHIQQGLRQLLACKSRTDVVEKTSSVLSIQKALLQYPWRVEAIDSSFWLANKELVSDFAMKQIKRDVMAHVRKNGISNSAGRRHVLSSQISVLFAMLSRTEIGLKSLSGNGNKKTVEGMDGVRLAFKNIIQVWTKAKELQDAKEALEGEKEPETEEEKEERLLREQFPDYAKEYKEIVMRAEDNIYDDDDDDNDEMNISEADGDISVDASFNLTEDQIGILCEIHFRIFGVEEGTSDYTLTDGRRRSTFLCGYEAAARLSPISEAAGKSGLDIAGVGGNLMGVSLNADLCKGIVYKDIDGDKNVVDFHLDPNPKQVLRAEATLNKVVMRVGTLLRAFPGHAVLITIGQIAEKLRQLPLTAPLGKVLVGLEVLLKKAQEWEQIASARVVIGDGLKEVSRLIAEWRKLELESWGSLLTVRERKKERDARMLWPRMWSVIHKHAQLVGVDGPVDLKKEASGKLAPSWVWYGIPGIEGSTLQKGSTENDDLTKLTQVLDGFILSCGIGQFEQRLKLLRSFAGELNWEVEQQKSEGTSSNTGISLFEQTARSLAALHKYYSQFRPLIANALVKLKAGVETKLKGEVKLAKWDDQNYYALAETTEKNHRKLNKFLRQYDEVLGMSVSSVLEQHYVKGVRDNVEGQANGATTAIPANSTMYPLAVEDNTAAIKSTSKAEAKKECVKSGIWTISTDVAIERCKDNSFVNGIDRFSKKMQKHLLNIKTSPSKDGTAECDLMVNSIFSRIDFLRGEKITKPMKQRGFVDLLKALKGQGLSSYGSTAPAELKITSHLFRLPTDLNNRVTKHFDDGCWEKADGYYNRCMVELSRLRLEINTLGSTHMGRRETGLMIGYGEHMMFLLVQQKCLILEGCANLFDMEKSLVGLRSVANDKDYQARSKGVSSLPPQIRSKALIVKSKLGLDAVTERLCQLKLLLASIGGQHDAVSVVDGLADICKSGQRKLTSYGSESVDISNVCIVTWSMLAECNNVGASLEKVSLELSKLVKVHKSDIIEDVWGGLVASLHSVAISFAALQCISESDGVSVSVRREISEDGVVDVITAAVKAALICVQEMVKSGDDLGKGLSTAADSKDEQSEEIAEVEDDEDLDPPSTPILDCHVQASKLWASTQLNSCNVVIGKVISAVEDLSEGDVRASPIEATKLITKCLDACALFAQIHSSSRSRLHDMIDFHRGVGKFLYVLLRVFRTLVAKGFCHDETKGDDGEGGDANAEGMTFEDDVEGTGMGEGEGKNDVTDQIENEEQLLGLKGDEDLEKPDKQQEKKELDEKDVDTGMEMENDFDGETYDLPEGKQEEEKDDDKDEKDDKEEELDRQMGEDSSPNEQVVDEKMWDSEDNEGDGDDGKQKQDEKFEKDSGVEGGETEDEIRTKEDEDEKPGKPEEKEDEKGKEEDKDDKKEEEKEGGDDDDEKGGKEDGKDEKNVEEDEEGPMNDDTEDKYEEKNYGMELGKDEKEDEKGEGEDDEMKLDDLDLEGDEGDQEDDKDENPEGGDAEEDEDAEAEGGEDSGEKQLEKAPEGEEEKEEDAPEEEGQASAPATVAGDVDMNDEDQGKEEEEAEEDEKPEAQEIDVEENNAENDGNEHGVSADNGKSSVAGEKEEEEEEEKEEEGDGDEAKEDGGGGQEAEQDEAMGQEDNGQGDWRAGEQDGEEGGEEGDDDRQKEEQLNPFRNPGDVMKFWHDRLKMMEEEGGGGGDDENADDKMDQDDDAQDESNVNPNSTFEFVKKGESGTTQVLGAVSEDQAVPQLPENDDGEEEDDADEGGDMGDIADDMEEKDLSKEEKKKEEEDKKKKKDKKKDKKDGKTGKKEEEEVKTPEEKAKGLKGAETDPESKDEGGDDDDEEGDEAKTNNDEDDMEEGTESDLEREEEERRIKVKTDMSQIKQDPDDMFVKKGVYINEDKISNADPEARSKWAELNASTLPLSRRLCEKLRLVMEPLVATKLQGDYRSGKRINMKRVISYIASGFRKDKIWLRRTKPAKRDYRVLLAIDDSESMLKGGGGDMALEALAIMANGMSQLEIGQLGVCKFGEEMKMLLSFDMPFTSESGASVVSQFKFDQQRTRTATCVEGAMNILEEGGNFGVGGGKKLLFLISDGRIERDNRQKLRSLVREMTEKGILLVMIIIDSTTNATANASGVSGKKDNSGAEALKKQASILNMREVEFINGKPKMKYFIEDYPFPLYLVVSELKGLPDILGDSLKQWFELMARIETHN